MSVWSRAIFVQPPFIPEVSSITNVGWDEAGICRVRFYSTDGNSLLTSVFVPYGEDVPTNINVFNNDEISILNQVGVTLTDSSVVDGVGQIDAYEYSAGYEGFNIRLDNLLEGQPNQIQFTFQTISGQYHSGSYTFGFKIFDNPVTSYPTGTQQDSGYQALIQDFDPHNYIITFIPQTSTAYLVFALPDYADSGQNVFKISNLKCRFSYVDDIWAITPNSGVAVPNVLQNITTNLDLYLARWKVDFYDYGGARLLKSVLVVDGEDAEFSTSLLTYSDSAKILAEALEEDYISGEQTWSGLSMLGSGYSKGANSVDFTTSGYATFDLGETNKPVTVYCVFKQDISRGGDPSVICLPYAESTGYCPNFFTRSGVLYTSVWGNDTNQNISALQWNVLAFTTDANKKVSFYINGSNAAPDKTFNTSGSQVVLLRGANNARPNAGSFKYVAVVDGTEDAQVIIQNQQNIMSYYNLS